MGYSSGLSQSSTDFVPIVPIVPRDEHLGEAEHDSKVSRPFSIDQFTGVGDKNNRGSSSIKTNHDNRSTPAIHDHKPYSAPSSLKCGYEEVSDGFSEASIYHSWPASSRPVACLEVELGAAAALLGVRIAAAAMFEADLVEYCLLLEGRPARIAETAREGFKKLFSTPAKLAQLAPRPLVTAQKAIGFDCSCCCKAVKAISACWRCKFLRKQVNRKLFN